MLRPALIPSLTSCAVTLFEWSLSRAEGIANLSIYRDYSQLVKHVNAIWLSPARSNFFPRPHFLQLHPFSHSQILHYCLDQHVAILNASSPSRCTRWIASLPPLACIGLPRLPGSAI